MSARGYRWYSLSVTGDVLGWSRTQSAALARAGTANTFWARDRPHAVRLWAQYVNGA